MRIRDGAKFARSILPLGWHQSALYRAQRLKPKINKCSLKGGIAFTDWLHKSSNDDNKKKKKVVEAASDRRDKANSAK